MTLNRHVVTQRWFNRRAYWNGTQFHLPNYCAVRTFTPQMAQAIAQAHKRCGYRNVSVVRLSLWQRIKLELTQ